MRVLVHTCTAFAQAHAHLGTTNAHAWPLRVLHAFVKLSPYGTVCLEVPKQHICMKCSYCASNQFWITAYSVFCLGTFIHFQICHHFPCLLWTFLCVLRSPWDCLRMSYNLFPSVCLSSSLGEQEGTVQGTPHIHAHTLSPSVPPVH